MNKCLRFRCHYTDPDGTRIAVWSDPAAPALERFDDAARPPDAWVAGNAWQVAPELLALPYQDAITNPSYLARLQATQTSKPKGKKDKRSDEYQLGQTDASRNPYTLKPRHSGE